jgi:hypothetical protein
MLFNRDSTIQKCLRRLYSACKSRFQVPVSRLDDVSSRSDVHLSTAPSVRTTCHTVRTPYRPSIIRPDDVVFRPDPPLYREAYVPACIRLDDSTARPDALQYSIKVPLLSKIIYRKIDANRSDDVDPHPDTLLLKARIAIQIRPSGRL